VGLFAKGAVKGRLKVLRGKPPAGAKKTEETFVGATLSFGAGWGGRWWHGKVGKKIAKGGKGQFNWA